MANKNNETKSVHIDLTNKRIEHKPIYTNHQVVPYENTAKYLGMTLDAKLRWKPHVKEKTGRTYTEIQKNISVNGSLFCPICTQGVPRVKVTTLGECSLC